MNNQFLLLGTSKSSNTNILKGLPSGREAVVPAAQNNLKAIPGEVSCSVAGFKWGLNQQKHRQTLVNMWLIMVDLG